VKDKRNQQTKTPANGSGGDNTKEQEAEVVNA